MRSIAEARRGPPKNDDCYIAASRRKRIRRALRGCAGSGTARLCSKNGEEQAVATLPGCLSLYARLGSRPQLVSRAAAIRFRSRRRGALMPDGTRRVRTRLRGGFLCLDAVSGRGAALDAGRPTTASTARMSPRRSKLWEETRREAVRSQVRRIIDHLLKLAYSPAGDPRRGWRRLDHRRPHRACRTGCRRPCGRRLSACFGQDLHGRAQARGKRPAGLWRANKPSCCCRMHVPTRSTRYSKKTGIPKPPGGEKP